MTYRSGGTADTPGSPFAPLYRQARADLLSAPVADQRVETTVGTNHLVTVGDPDAPPLLLLQGTDVTNLTLSRFQSLGDDYHLLAPDTPGEPGEMETIPSVDYGVDRLALWRTGDRTGTRRRRLAWWGRPAGDGRDRTGRLSAATLVFLAGFGVSPSTTLARVVGLSLAYRLLPRERLLEAALVPLFTTPVADLPPVVRETVALAPQTADVKIGFPGPDDPDALTGFGVPTVLIAGEYDPFFPAGWLHERSRAFLPTDTEWVTLAGERHFPSAAGQRAVAERVRSFLVSES